MRISDWSSDVCSSDLTLQTEADLAGDVAALTLQWRGRAGGAEIFRRVLFLVTLVTQAHHGVRVPVAAFGDEVAAQVERDAVLAPVQVVVTLGARILVVQLSFERPVRYRKSVG